jgi:hypothetical protein|tara:strand:- start:236 stop:454 length:219 start_codon:yes stop_codon:yes gene_type:complete
MGKVKELWMVSLEKLQEDYCEANITEEEFRRSMGSLGVDCIDIDCYIIEAKLLRAVNESFKPFLNKNAKPEM